MAERQDAPPPAIDLYWIPLGAGGSGFVRLNGRLYERAVASRDHRRPLALYHTALEVRTAGDRYVVETVWPPPDADGHSRGVVLEGAVGARWLGRLRAFRYEVRCWKDGILPDAGAAVGGPRQVTASPGVAERLLEECHRLPHLCWGREPAALDEMWTSNSVVSWLLARSGVPVHHLRPPDGGRAPGWDAGVRLAASGPSRPAQGAGRRVGPGARRAQECDGAGGAPSTWKNSSSG